MAVSARLADIMRLIWNSTLDFSVAYTIAQVNDAFFGASWQKVLDFGVNAPQDGSSSILSLAIRCWLQVIVTALVGSEARTMLLPTEQLENSFSLVLFIIGIAQQPGLWDRLQSLTSMIQKAFNGATDKQILQNNVHQKDDNCV